MTDGDIVPLGPDHLMKRPILALASALLMIPALSVGGAVLAQSRDVPLPLGFDAVVPDPFRSIDRARQAEIAEQVRVERRVVIRIAPSSDATRARLMAELPRRPIRTRFEEIEHGRCVAVSDLAGVQPMDDNRLLLITRDRRMLTAELDRSCAAQAFYSGFYIDRSEDGQLCVGRDQLQSRSGDSCELEQLRRLVAVRD